MVVNTNVRAADANAYKMELVWGPSTESDQAFHNRMKKKNGGKWWDKSLHQCQECFQFAEARNSEAFWMPMREKYAVYCDPCMLEWRLAKRIAHERRENAYRCKWLRDLQFCSSCSAQPCMCYGDY